ncbi:histidine phosphatase family protein [Mesorhizobium sp. WSM4303]|uniref:histidine phosphatase family protein n=1 Tax=unclassified Mesorhizobium TaxID=325217 RepID=UPI00115E6DBA|nr:MULTISPECIES: histidine phosphatase family protein [unclassified Mesorhizobium]TRC93005.1 histidine phosphatase family protein [Mesorhizobium sp. WSM4303]TRC96117.1 histidine phosphatase family protein [Mesorhizobium sp. WSM4306]
MLVRLTLICSGATPAMRKGSFPLDEALEPRSLALAATMTLRGADRVWTGPALRARQTAEAMGLKPSVEPLLAEQDFGSWAGKGFAEVQALDPNGVAAWLGDAEAAPHGGESLADVARRTASFLDDLIRTSGHTVAVTHASVIRAAIVHVLGAPLAACRRIDVEPLSLTDLRSDGHRWMLRSSGIPVAKPAKSDKVQRDGAQS